MRPNVSIKGLDATEDAFTFRETRSDHVFSPWDAEEISTSATFSIANAVADLEALHLGDNEDLAELDSGPPRIPLPTGSDTLVEPSHECSRHPCHLRTAGPSIEAQFDLREVHIAATGWIGLRDNGVLPEETEAGVKQEGYTPIHLLPDFFGIKVIFHSFHLAKYLGPCMFIFSSLSLALTSPPAKAVPLLTNVARSAPFLGGALPRTTSWTWCTTQPWKRWKRCAQCSLADEQLLHRRGNWAPLTKGASFDDGQTEPGELLNGVINTTVLCCLVSNLGFIRFAGFATGVFAAWAPDLFNFYVDYMRLFYSHYPRLRHHDFANLAYGWRTITALGNFDYTKGRHLILWDCKLIIEFPPGTTILIPSAAIFHSNIPVAEGEHRYFFTQYTAGGEEWELGKERASECVGLFSTIAELKAMA
ncbi:hypothetical protein DFH09DRAFT_1312405 [Mycena vulgaris]|nr:hypothetical protein DFH09DRAFT_1312405 [Mycena vulgaris]